MPAEPEGQYQIELDVAPFSSSSAMDEGEQEAVPGQACLDPREEASTIEELEQSAVPKEGDDMYLISSRWWDDWRSYSGYDNGEASTSDVGTQDNGASSSQGQRPSSIDNSSLTTYNPIDWDQDPPLKDDLEEGRDFVIVTQQSWQQLSSWYGGGPPIRRKAVIEGVAHSTKRARVMLYPMKLEAYYSGTKSEPRWIEVDKAATIADLKAKLCALFEVQEADTVLWDYYKHSKYLNLEETHLHATLSAAKLLEEQPVLLQDKSAPDADDEATTSGPILLGAGDATGPSMRHGRNSLANAQADSIIERLNVRRGLAGLQNLGNTCFMNSSLQCLMHAVPVMRVFLSSAYELDINTTNPLGMKGELATAFASLMDNVWKGNVGVVVPRSFKSRISAFAPQFSGYQQHDSQEFLAFLLDGLHEDINRIKDKPYIEEKDNGSRPDAELAAEAWANYRARNDSAIVDHFQGLYKSTLDCPKCGYSSVKFDPFMYLSLPLPESRVRNILAILIRTDGSAAPVEYGVQVPQTGTLRDLYGVVLRAAGINTEQPEALCCAAVIEARYSSYGLSVFADAKARIAEILQPQAPSVLVYLYPTPEEGPGPDKRQLVVFHQNQSPYPPTRGGRGFFSAPLLLWLDKEEAAVEPELVVERKGLMVNAKEYVVQHSAPVWGRIHRMLAPFCKGPVYEGPKASSQNGEEAADDGANGNGVPTSSADVTMQAQASPTGNGSAPSPDVVMGGTTPKHPSSNPAAESATPATAAARGANGVPMPAGGAAAAANGSVGMEDMAITPTSSSWVDRGAAAASTSRAGAVSPMDGTWGSSIAGSDIAEATTPATTPAGATSRVPANPDDDPWGERPAKIMLQPAAGPSTPAGDGGPAVPVPPPFDMWSHQAAPPQPAALPSPSAQSIPPPYELKLCTDKGMTDYYTFGAPSTADAQRSHSHFVLDWNPAAAAAAAEAAAAAGAAQQPEAATAAAAAAAGPGSPLPPPMALPGPLLVGGYDLHKMEQPKIDPSADELKKRSAEPAKSVSLSACVEAFLQPEQLSAADEWYCSHCKEFVQADKKLDLWHLPEVLVVHLKRFSYTRWNRDKIDTTVDFPLAGLDLSPYVLAPQQAQPLYDCFAVSNHFGGLGGGHYTAYAQMPDDKRWYCFDDSRVEPVTQPEHIVGQAAYVLFYRRRDAVQADAADLVEQLFAQRQAAEAAAAAAAAEQQRAAQLAADGQAADRPAGSAAAQEAALVAAAADASGNMEGLNFGDAQELVDMEDGYADGDNDATGVVAAMEALRDAYEPSDGDVAGTSGGGDAVVLTLSAAGHLLQTRSGGSERSDGSAAGEQGSPRGDADAGDLEEPGCSMLDGQQGLQQDHSCMLQGTDAVPAGAGPANSRDTTSGNSCSSSDSGSSSSRRRQPARIKQPMKTFARRSTGRKQPLGAAVQQQGQQADIEMADSDRLR